MDLNNFQFKINLIEQISEDKKKTKKKKNMPGGHSEGLHKDKKDCFWVCVLMHGIQRQSRNHEWSSAIWMQRSCGVFFIFQRTSDPALVPFILLRRVSRSCSPDSIDFTFCLMEFEFFSECQCGENVHRKDYSRNKNGQQEAASHCNLRVKSHLVTLTAGRTKRKIPSTYPQKIFPVNHILYVHGGTYMQNSTLHIKKNVLFLSLSLYQ